MEIIEKQAQKFSVNSCLVYSNITLFRTGLNDDLFPWKLHIIPQSPH